MATGTHDYFVEQRERWLAAREILQRRFGQPPSVFDIAWRLLNEDLMTHGAMGNWASYRDTRFSMGELLRAEGRWKNALLTYLEVCYLDLNGPQNRVDLNHQPRVAATFRPFNPRRAMLAPRLLELSRKLVGTLQMTTDDLRKCFQNTAEPQHCQLRLPVDPQSGWRRFERGLRAGPSATPGSRSLLTG